MIRVGDMRLRRAPLVNCEVKLLLISDHITQEGEKIPFYTQRLEVDMVSQANKQTNECKEVVCVCVCACVFCFVFLRGKGEAEEKRSGEKKNNETQKMC